MTLGNQVPQESRGPGIGQATYRKFCLERSHIDWTNLKWWGPSYRASTEDMRRLLITPSLPVTSWDRDRCTVDVHMLVNMYAYSDQGCVSVVLMCSCVLMCLFLCVCSSVGMVCMPMCTCAYVCVYMVSDTPTPHQPSAAPSPPHPVLGSRVGSPIPAPRTPLIGPTAQPSESGPSCRKTLVIYGVSDF